MAFIPVPNSAQLCFDFTTAGQNWQFCVVIRKSAPPLTSTDLANASAVAASWWSTNLRPLIQNNTVLRQTRATDISVEGGGQSIATVGTAGTNGGILVPLNAALVVSLRTAKRGRSYRGRIYLGGLEQTDLVSETDVAGAYVTSVLAAIAALQSQLDTNSFDLVVASKQHNKVVTNPAETNEVIAATCDSHIDSQRRRLFGRGT